MGVFPCRQRFQWRTWSGLLVDLGLRPLLVFHLPAYHHSHHRDNVVASHWRPNLRSRLHYRHNQEGNNESSQEHVVVLKKKKYRNSPETGSLVTMLRGNPVNEPYLSSPRKSTLFLEYLLRYEDIIQSSRLRMGFQIGNFPAVCTI